MIFVQFANTRKNTSLFSLSESTFRSVTDLCSKMRSCARVNNSLIKTTNTLFECIITITFMSLNVLRAHMEDFQNYIVSDLDSVSCKYMCH